MSSVKIRLPHSPNRVGNEQEAEAWIGYSGKDVDPYIQLYITVGERVMDVKIKDFQFLERLQRILDEILSPYQRTKGK